MINPCPKKVLCPPGTGVETSGTNYSAEHRDIPEYRVHYYPPTPYGYYTACVGRCISILSQADADLCAQRLGKICLNETPPGPKKPTFDNTVVVCQIPSTGKMVIVPAGMFTADSQAEADAMAIDYANTQQKAPGQPPELGGGGGGGGGGDIPINIIPLPTPRRQPPRPTSQCKPCDDTGASGNFSLTCNVPAQTVPMPEGQVLFFESPPLKCGTWTFSIQTLDGGSIDDTQSNVSLTLVAANPARTPLSWNEVFDCPMPAFINPCSVGDCSTPASVRAFGLNACCAVTSVTACNYADCHHLPDGSRWLVILIVQYARTGSVGNSAVSFKINGQLTAPLPTPP